MKHPIVINSCGKIYNVYKNINTYAKRVIVPTFEIIESPKFILNNGKIILLKK